VCSLAMPEEAAQVGEAPVEYGFGASADEGVPDAEAFEHADAQRRFRTVTSVSVEELERALEYPWDKWTVFLHPAQRRAVEKDYGGTARVAGSAGTGKTIVALHRAVFMARTHPDARVLLATFSETLANALRTRLREEVFDTERHLLYVACTRARDQLLVTAVAPGSEFLDDPRAGQPPMSRSL